MIARFGRALNFGRPNPIPIWSRGDANIFPSGLGVADILFDVANQPVTPNYRGPFVDLSTLILGDIGYAARMRTRYTHRARIQQGIDREGQFPSSRLTFTVDEHDD